MLNPPNFSCAECGKDSGSSLVCPSCIPLLSAYKKQKVMKTLHKIIIERDGNECVFCGHPATTDSGELCCNHNPTQASAPDKIFDVTLHECTCMNCNGKHSYTAPKEVKKQVAASKFTKPPVCEVKGCPIFAGGRNPKRCFRHQ